MLEFIKKFLCIKTVVFCDGNQCNYDPETDTYTIRGKKYGAEFFDILKEYNNESIFRVVVRNEDTFSIKKLPQA